ncbi:MAG: hypothetical protein AAFX94_13915, partial [Myxococcota bacterium]
MWVLACSALVLSFDCPAGTQFTERAVALEGQARGVARWCARPASAGAVRHGPFESWTLDGSPVEQGSYENGLESGSWRHYYRNGHLEWTGERYLGVNVGAWSYFHENGQKSAEGQLLEGYREGVWQEWNAQGALIRERSYQDGQLDGPATDFYPDGQ